ncbi:MAG: hypothetical protein ABI945_10150 [Nitrospirales bacterium]
MVAISVLNFSGCTATPVHPRIPHASFKGPLLLVQDAALNSIVISGFAVDKTEMSYIEASRIRIQGTRCSPGGEAVGIWFEENGDEIKVFISTATTFFGMLCQRDWTPMIWTK